MVVFIFFLFIFFISRYIIRDTISKVFINAFVGIWSVAILFSMTGFYQIDIPQDYTFILLSLHLISFYLGFIFVTINKKKLYAYIDTDILSKFNIEIDRIIYRPFFIIVLVFALVYVTQLSIVFFDRIVFLQSMGDARSEFFEESIFGSSYYYINNFFLSPFNTFLSFIVAYKSFYKRDFLWIICLVYLLLYHFVGGGRMGYVKLFTAFVFVAIVFKNKINNRKSSSSLKYFMISAVCIILYLSINIITAARMGDLEIDQTTDKENVTNSNEQLYSYLICPVVAFDYSLKHDFVDQIGGQKNGTLSFSCIEEIFYIFFQKIGWHYNRPLIDYTNVIQNNYYYIGEHTSWNALYTWCNYFYCDFKFWGILFLPFIMGMLFRKLINFYYTYSNVFSASLMTLSFIYLCFTIITFPFTAASYFLTICLFLYLGKHIHILVKNKQI